MNILLIGGTGRISSAVTRLLAEEGHRVFLLNRGNRKMDFPGNVRSIVADINDEPAVAAALRGMTFDVVCDFICYTPDQAERDVRLFRRRTGQFVFISSAAAYEKPPKSPYITEDTPLSNPYWQYARDKIACETYLFGQYRDKGFPVTVVRPSHTYNETSVPVGVHGTKGSWQVVKRMLEGKPILVHGDGSSLWTMTDSRDFARGFAGLLGNPGAMGEAVQITSDESLTWNQIYSTIAGCLGVEYRPCYVPSTLLGSIGPYDLTGNLLGDKANSVIFNNAKLKALVPDFVPAIPFAAGVKRTLDHVLSHPECQAPDPEFDAWCDRLASALCNLHKDLTK